MLIAAQIDPVQNLNPAFDNTLLVLEAAGRRGHQIFYYTPDKLRTDHQGRVTANGHELALNLAADDFYALGKARLLDLSEADVVLLRQDPPVTMDYITTTYILEKLPPSTLVINHPKAVRDFPEKILPLHFPGLIPPTLITRDQEAMQEFHRAHGEIVIKPLYARQSQGVIRLKKNGDNLAAAAGPLLARYQTPLVCQRFLPEVQDGVKRLTLIDGEIFGIFKNTPPPGEFLVAASLAVSPYEKTELSPGDLAIAQALKPFLKTHGLFWAGVDIIGNFIAEINLTSPSGLRALARLGEGDIGDKFCQVLENKMKK